MAKINNEVGENVYVSMELTGEYEDVVRKLHVSSNQEYTFEPLISDLQNLMETLAQMDGGTRSAIAEKLPEDMVAIREAQDVVEALGVLEKYGLVHLEGNTWTPGGKPQ